MVNGSAEKIIWLYGEYQPAYMELSSKFPHILFIEGIPENLNEYIDPKFRNLIVIDDLMSETRKLQICSQKVAIIETLVLYCFFKIYFIMERKVEQ